MISRQRLVSMYEEALALTPYATPELRDVLKTSDRVPGFIDRLMVELKLVGDLLHRRGQRLDDVKLKALVYGLTDVFVVQFEETARARYESDMMRHAKLELERMRNKPDEMLKEMGVTTDGQTESSGSSHQVPQELPSARLH